MTLTSGTDGGENLVYRFDGSYTTGAAIVPKLWIPVGGGGGGETWVGGIWVLNGY